jgi:hypothetical protein
MNELWEWVWANSLSGIHEFKSICGDIYNAQSLGGPVTKYMFQIQGARVQIQKMKFNIFSSLGA